LEEELESRKIRQESGTDVPTSFSVAGKKSHGQEEYL